MRRVAELVDGSDALDLVPAVDQDARITGEGRSVARNRNHQRRLARREPLGLSQRTLPWRIEYDRKTPDSF